MLEFNEMKSLKGILLLILVLFLIFGIGLVLLWVWGNASWLNRFTHSTGVEPSIPNEAPGYSSTATLPQTLSTTLSPSASAIPGLSPGNYALSFNTGEYLHLGAGPGLGLTTFTLETWFQRTDAGSATSLGNTGILAIPLIVKGYVETGQQPANLNYFLGINADEPVLLADFVEGERQANPGQHHLIMGVTPVQEGTWHHAAVTLDGMVLRLYLDGNLENTVEVGPDRLPAITGAQYVGLAGALSANGELVGSLVGLLDEVRLWNLAHTQAEIQSQINLPVETAPGLVGRWGFDEGVGQVVRGSAGSRLKGVVQAQIPNWVSGAPFNIVFPSPQVPVALTATPGSAYLIELAWSDTANNETAFDVERVLSDGSTNFLTSLPVNTTFYQDTLVLPETEYCYHVRAVNLQGLSEYTPIACVVTPAESDAALSLGIDGAYISMDHAPALDSGLFTIETWLQWTGSGIPFSTGLGGLPQAIPLITYGGLTEVGSESVTGWTLAIDAATGVLAADIVNSNSGQHHPLYGTHAILPGAWHHAAATYDGSVWRMYLDGQFEAEAEVYLPVLGASPVRLGLGMMQNPDGTPLGLFQGALDETRFWNIAHTHAQVLVNMNRPQTRGEGLVARWGFGEGEGRQVHDSIAGQANGAIHGTEPTWLRPGAPFDVIALIPPDQPTLVSPVMGSPNAAATLPLQVLVNDVNGQDLNVTFYGRPVVAMAENPFTFVLLPDTQNYSLSDAAAELFQDQTNWIVSQQSALNIQFVSHLGDMTERGNIDGEWQRVDQALAILEQGGVRYGIIPGNHDRTEDYGDYKRYFPPDRYLSYEWYGGYLGDPGDGIPDFGVDRQNLDNYQLFSVGTIDFIFINLEINPPQFVIEWANALLQAFPGRQAVITTHAFIDANGERPSVPYINEPGQKSAEAVWQQLIFPNCNVLMVLNGHYPGEARRTDLNVCGEPVYQMVQDYQYRSNGGDGWLRYLVFEPADGQIEGYTYSPSLNEFEDDADSRFTLDFPIEAGNPFEVIGSVTVPVGTLAEVVWANLVPGTAYEWYAVVSDGSLQTNGATWDFSTRP